MWSSLLGKWLVVAVFGILVVLLLVPSGHAQGVGPVTPSAGSLGAAMTDSTGSWSPLASTMGCLAMGKMHVIPFARVGYQQMSVGYNLPAAWNYTGVGSPPPPGYPANLDLRIKNANAWVGAAGLKVQLNPTWSVYFLGEGVIGRNVKVKASEEPLQALGFAVNTVGSSVTDPLRWTGSHMEWWGLDGGGEYVMGRGISLLAGLKGHQFSVALVDGRDAGANPLNNSLLIGGALFEDAAGGDLQAKVWIPYLGIALKSDNYRCTFLWSPFVSTQIKSPFSLMQYETISPFPGYVGYKNNWRYSSHNPGAYLEGLFEYDLSWGQGTLVTLWCQGRWLNARGKGGLDTGLTTFAAAPFWILPGPGDIPTTSNSDAATYSVSSIAGGLSVSYPF